MHNYDVINAYFIDVDGPSHGQFLTVLVLIPWSSQHKSIEVVAKSIKVGSSIISPEGLGKNFMGIKYLHTPIAIRQVANKCRAVSIAIETYRRHLAYQGTSIVALHFQALVLKR